MKLRYLSVSRKRTIWVKTGDGSAITGDEAAEINEWVLENDIGIRTAYDMWRMDSDEAVTLFLLRWG